MTKCLIDFLKKQEVEYYEALDMSRISSIGIGGTAAFAVVPSSEEGFINVLNFLWDNGIRHKVVGRMTNILPCDGFYDGVLIINRKLDRYYVAENTLTACCGANFSYLLKRCAELSLGGAEGLFGIPGSVGGMVYGNAGAYGKEISDIFISARLYYPNEKRIFTLSNSEMKFSYRESRMKSENCFLLSADFALTKAPRADILQKMREIISARKSTQPYDEKSLGSIFKRSKETPISLLIDRLGLKGLSVGGAEISQKHAGFIVNRGGATAEDVKALISMVKEKIYSSYGIAAEEEIEFL